MTDNRPAPMPAPAAPALPPWHGLLAAIVENLDVPLPEDYHDTPAYHRLLETRVWQLSGYIRGLVAELHEPDSHAGGIRRMTATTPVTYAPYTAPENSREAGR